jgi:outer membrane protein TolC
VGLATNLDRITAQDRLLSTQLQLAGEQFNRKVFQLTLLRATGRLVGQSESDPWVRPTSMPTTNPATNPATMP